MAFVTLKFADGKEISKIDTEKLARRWRGQLEGGGLPDNQVIAVDPGRILLVVPHGKFLETKKFILEQNETDWLELKNIKYFPGHSIFLIYIYIYIYIIILYIYIIIISLYRRKR
eukprot:GHVL01039718.1.p1 GENE.GHVL01039718.1~~GHVL01039718.1.p1  ORF type:complete len:115 (+),score=31.59 GHVL01039718.1:77-421(+)